MNTALTTPAGRKMGRVRPVVVFDLPTVRVMQFPDGTVKIVAKLSPHYNASRATVAPTNTNWYAKALASIKQMYGNDTAGDCVIASKLHAIGVATGNESGTAAVGTTQEALSLYSAICGPGDNGCVITNVLDAMKAGQFTCGGQVHTLDNYVAFDNTSQQLTAVGVNVFGGNGCIGINLPQAWDTAGPDAIWDVPSGSGANVVGGHDIEIVDVLMTPAPSSYYNGLFTGMTGVVCATWGGLVLVTWPAFNHKAAGQNWGIEEAYFWLPKDWYSNGNLSPNGISSATLANDLQMIGSGTIPPLPGPTPPGGTVAVPNVVGQDWVSAQAAIQVAGLVPMSATGATTGTVVNQAPAAGTVVQVPSNVSCTLSTTPPPPVGPTPLYTLHFNRALSKGQTAAFVVPVNTPKGSELSVYPPSSTFRVEPESKEITCE